MILWSLVTAKWETMKIVPEVMMAADFTLLPRIK
jgi:hypothetical protein